MGVDGPASRVLVILALGLAVEGCGATSEGRDEVPQVLAYARRLRFAVVGDYGKPTAAAAEVAAQVRAWQPDLVITSGDNNYPNGAAATIDDNVGRLYASFIHPYTGRYGPGATQNRFFPALGNHDLYTEGGRPYFDYFALPGNERYYEFAAGPVNFFALNSDGHEPDGTGPWSRQRRWLESSLASSRACWRIVYFHHPPWVSGSKESPRMRWPFAAWGADVVFSGHQHVYERLVREGVTYVVVGTSGGSLDRFERPVEAGSVARFADDYGAVLVTIDDGTLDLAFVTRDGRLVDSSRLVKSCPVPPER